MYRVYLDWNVVSNLKKCPNEHYTALLALIRTHRSRLWIPYSLAHLRDLHRGYDATDPQKVRLTYRDLGNLVLLTKCMCLETTHKQHKPRKMWRDPYEYFEDLEAHAQEEPFTFEGITSAFTDSSIPEVNELGGVLLNLFELTPMPYPAQHSPELASLFPNWREKGNMAGLMQDIFGLTERAQKDFTYTRELRAMVDNGLPGVSPSAVSSAAPLGAFDRIDQLVSPLIGGQSFTKMLEGIQGKTASEDKPKSEWDRFIESYYMLDLFGYKRDEASARKHFPNTLDDITHAYMAGHCDIFIAEDAKLRAKAAAVYGQMNVFTRICTPEEAVKELTERLNVVYTAKSFFGIFDAMLKEVIEDGRPIKWEDEEEPGVHYFYLGWLFLDRFNVIRIDTNGESGLEYTLLEWKLSFADSLMSEEVTELVGVLLDCLGLDSYSLGSMQASEWTSFTDGTWEGRTWDYERMTLRLGLDPQRGLVFAYQLTVPPITPEPPTPAPEPIIEDSRSWFKRWTSALFGGR